MRRLGTWFRKGLVQGYPVTLRQNRDNNLHPVLCIPYNGQIIYISREEKVLWVYACVLSGSDTEASFWQGIPIIIASIY
jgi:hypothetical protein